MTQSSQLAIYQGVLDKSLASKFSRGRRGDLNWAAEKQYALAAIAKNEALQRCTPESFAMTMLDVAWSGLSLNPVTSHGYLIPYDGIMTFKPSYRGLEHLVHRAGTIKSIQTVLVRKEDKFRVETKDNRRIVTHVEQSSSNSKVTHAYCILHYANGGEYVEVMDIIELEKVKAAAMARPRGGMVWKGPWEGEMQRKAVLRRALKHAPLDGAGHIQHAIEVHDKFDPVDFAKQPVEREPVEELISREQSLKAHAFLTDRSLSGKIADEWLTKLAEAMGFESFDKLPVKHYDEAMKRLDARYVVWKQRQKV